MIDRRQLRATWRRILFRNVFSFTAMVSIFLLASVVAIYILDHQNVRLPILDEKAWTLKAEFTTAQAVVPGQGQTIRVSVQPAVQLQDALQENDSIEARVAYRGDEHGGRFSLVQDQVRKL